MTAAVSLDVVLITCTGECIVRMLSADFRSVVYVRSSILRGSVVIVWIFICFPQCGLAIQSRYVIPAAEFTWNKLHRSRFKALVLKMPFITTLLFVWAFPCFAIKSWFLRLFPSTFKWHMHLQQAHRCLTSLNCWHLHLWPNTIF